MCVIKPPEDLQIREDIALSYMVSAGKFREGTSDYVIEWWNEISKIYDEETKGLQQVIRCTSSSASFNYKRKWVGGDCGHCDIYENNQLVITCDDNELNETLSELEDIVVQA